MWFKDIIAKIIKSKDKTIDETCLQAFSDLVSQRFFQGNITTERNFYFALVFLIKLLQNLDSVIKDLKEIPVSKKTKNNFSFFLVNIDPIIEPLIKKAFDSNPEHYPFQENLTSLKPYMNSKIVTEVVTMLPQVRKSWDSDRSFYDRVQTTNFFHQFLNTISKDDILKKLNARIRILSKPSFFKKSGGTKAEALEQLKQAIENAPSDALLNTIISEWKKGKVLKFNSESEANIVNTYLKSPKMNEKEMPNRYFDSGMKVIKPKISEKGNTFYFQLDDQTIEGEIVDNEKLMQAHRNKFFTLSKKTDTQKFIEDLEKQNFIIK